MIHFDTTKASSAAHRSGLTRVNARLLAELGPAARAVVWDAWDRSVRAGDWFLAAELFSEAERPGLRRFLADRPCRCGALFYDAIPLRFPHIVWPRSVARHPEYMKLLAEFDRVWAISEASRADLLGYWRWLGVARPPPVDLIALGADSEPVPRVTRRAVPVAPSLVCVGILEPRKNQAFLLDVCARLWEEGLVFDLHLFGRANPHFGGPILDGIKAMGRKWDGLWFHGPAKDSEIARVYATARASLFPTLAEGCGLPLLESLWRGVPCICSDLPVLRENADGGGCVAVATSDRLAWGAAVRRMLEDDPWHGALEAEAMARPLPVWREAAERILCAVR